MFFREFGTRVAKTLRTSIVIDPPDGRIPALTPAAAELKRKRLDAMRKIEVSLHKFVTREGERRVRAREDGQRAFTIFRRVEAWPRHAPPVALLEAELKTGRTHQIRVHLAHLGHALAGDDKYGEFAWNRELAREGLKRMFLHARAVTFKHPVTGHDMTVESAMPEELARFVTALGSPSP